MHLSFVDLTRALGASNRRPCSISLIREATREGLQRRGIECSAGPEADLTLVDVLDDGLDLGVDGDEAEALRACEGPLLVRVHAVPGGHAPSASLSALLSRSDGVIVSTRSHLVRLGSAGLLDADRTDLIAPAVPTLTGVSAPVEGTGALVLGDHLPEALEVALQGLALNSSLLGPDAQDEGAGRRFRALMEQHTLAVLTTTEHGEDGVIAESCRQVGRALVAPGGLDLNSQPHCYPVGSAPGVQDWTDALRAALGAAPTAGAPDARGEGRLDRLARVLSRAKRRPDCLRASAA